MRPTLLTRALALCAFAPLALALSSAPRPVRATDSPPMLGLWKTPILATAPPGTDFFLRCKTYLKANHRDTPLRLQRDAFGRSDTVYWFVEYEDLAARLQWERKERSDEGWQALMAEAREVLEFEKSDFLYLFPLGPAPLDDLAKPFRRLRVTQSRRFRAPEARRLAQEIVEHLEATYPELDARAFSADLNDETAVYWIVDYESLVAFESVLAKLLQDDAYIRLMASADDVFLEGASSQLLSTL